jgi:hypothetical protein
MGNSCFETRFFQARDARIGLQCRVRSDKYPECTTNRKKHFGHADQAIVSLNTWRATDYSQNKLLSNAYPMSLATRGLLQFSGLQYVTSYSATSVRLNDRAVEKLTQLSGEQDV